MQQLHDGAREGLGSADSGQAGHGVLSRAGDETAKQTFLGRLLVFQGIGAGRGGGLGLEAMLLGHGGTGASGLPGRQAKDTPFPAWLEP